MTMPQAFALSSPPTMTPEELKSLLRQLRIKQSDLCEMADLHPTTVSAWAQGRRPVPPAMVLALRLMSVSDDWRAWGPIKDWAPIRSPGQTDGDDSAGG